MLAAHIGKLFSGFVATALISGLLAASCARAQSSQTSLVKTDSSLCAASRQALVLASKVRQLAPRSEVPCVVQDKQEVSEFIHETIREDLPPQKLAMEELAYRAIGLIPDTFDYQHELVEFLVSQIGGYYNPKKKLFVMAGWLPASVQAGVAVHELTHALQDQYYNLQSLMQPKSATTDSGMAASALIEGDASAVMFDYERQASGQSPLERAQSIEPLLLMQVLGLGLGSDVPESVKALLIFPYTSGLRFVHALLRQGGYAAVHRAYSRPPKTTREILHPEDYLSGSFSPKIPLDSEVDAVQADIKPDYTDVLGEFGISSIFRGAVVTKDRGAAAAAGWLGDKLVLFPERNGVRIASWLTRWESETDAEQFAGLYREYLSAVYSKPLGQGRSVLTTNRSVAVTQRGSAVSVVVEERVAVP